MIMKNILLLGSSIIMNYKKCKIHNYNIINKGIAGYTVNEIPLKNNFNPKYMIFYCGNNDLKNNITSTQVILDIQNFINKFQELYPDTKIIILSILLSPKNHQLNLIDDIQYINSHLKKINKIKYININREISHKKYYIEDDVHLNIFGYEKLNKILNNNIN